MSLIETMQERRAATKAALDALLQTPLDEAREATDVENTAAEAKIAELRQIDARIAELVDAEAREAAAANALGAIKYEPRATVTSEPHTYEKGGANSYFRDMMVNGLNHGDTTAARERLVRNAREVAVDAAASDRPELRALTTVAGAGGEFVPPLWQVQDFVQLARAARPTANLLRQESLPGGTNSINLPVLSSGTATAVQTTQNTAVQNTDAVTSSVTAVVQTVAGQQVIAVQLLEQSPINMDTILLNDLARDYATKLDVAVISGAVTNAKGLLNVTGIIAETYTDASPAVAGAGKFYAKGMDAIQQIQTNYFGSPTAVVMHPRRWAWIAAAADTAGRPLVVPNGAAFNPVGTQNQLTAQGGPVGTLWGLPVYIDASIPVNLGAGTNEDRVIIANFDESILFESAPRAEAFRETKADQLSVLLRFYNYYAIHDARYPKSIAVMAGTGLVAPTF
jgi:HK97 family phage major capsid protein